MSLGILGIIGVSVVVPFAQLILRIKFYTNETNVQAVANLEGIESFALSRLILSVIDTFVLSL